MKHTSKRLQALVLVLAMCVSFLQIPSFADAIHTDTPYQVENVQVDKDGNLTIVKGCSDHPTKVDATCTETVTGKIVKNAKGTYEAVDAKGAVLEGVTVNVTETDATCIKAGTISYEVFVNGKSYGKSKAYETTAATGKHNFGTVDKTLSFEDLSKKDSGYELVSDAANCSAPGDAVFAKKCEVCGAASEDAAYRVSVKHKVGHENVVDEKGNDVVFKEEIKPATCAELGTEYHYYECRYCGEKTYVTETGLSTSKALAKEFATDVKAQPQHVLKYEVVLANEGTYVTKASVERTNLFTVKVSCANCKYAKTLTATDKLLTEKTVKPEKVCAPGSAVYEVTYNVAAPTEKDPNATKEVKEEVTVPYWMYAKNDDRSQHDFGTPIYDDESVVKATCTKDGSYNMVKICKVCGEKEVVATVKIPATGKHTAAAAKKENVVAATTKKGGSYDLVVRCADCGEIISSTHKTTAKIVVKASKVTKATNVKGKKAKITVKKAASVTGYQIQYGTKKNFKGAKSVKTKATTKTVSKLAKKKYYVRVRTYKVVSGKTYYSSWSGAKTVTIKK